MQQSQSVAGKKNALSPCQNVKKKENILLNTTAAAVERGKAGGFNLNLIFGNIKNKDEMKKKFLMLFMGSLVIWSQKNNTRRRRWNSEQKNLFIISKHAMGARLALYSSIFFIQNLHSAKINARSTENSSYLIWFVKNALVCENWTQRSRRQWMN